MNKGQGHRNLHGCFAAAPLITLHYLTKCEEQHQSNNLHHFLILHKRQINDTANTHVAFKICVVYF